MSEPKELRDPAVEVKADEQALLLDHDYDGIRELDHVLPRWWLMLFYGTIVFAAIYVGYYMVGSGPSLREELEVAMREINAKKPKQVPVESDEKDLQAAAAAASPDFMKLGKVVFSGKCMPCHGQNGEGGIGPNLTDDYWLHGNGTPKDIAHVVQGGVPEKGMPAWGEMLKPDEVKAVVVYIKSLHGTNPPGAKPPQGKLQANNEPGVPKS
jgi:cytochrome c oxidase cbb3-type subunit III